MKVLVAVASKHGSTEEIAEEVGRVLADTGIDNEVRPVEDVDALDGRLGPSRRQKPPASAR